MLITKHSNTVIGKLLTPTTTVIVRRDAYNLFTIYFSSHDCLSTFSHIGLLYFHDWCFFDGDILQGSADVRMEPNSKLSRKKAKQ